MKQHIKIIVFSALLLAGHYCNAIDKLRIDDKTSLFSVTDNTVEVIQSSYVGWGKNWQWAGANISLKHSGNSENYSNPVFAGQIPDLNINFMGTITPKANRIIWTYEWDKKSNYPDAGGFGIQFNIQLTSPSFSAKAQVPELLSNNRGWKWKTPDGQTIEVLFQPALANIYFEPGQENIIRAMFFSAINTGKQQTTMTVNVSNKVTIAEPVFQDDTQKKLNQWHQSILLETASPVDLSFLNKNDIPAGRHGFITTNQDKLVFSDGSPAKFWGANVMAYALFSTSDTEIKKHAKRISQLGFNLIRIHHHDSKWVNPNIFDNPGDNTQKLSADSFKKLDWWIKCLKDEGIYVWLDLHAGRTFTKNDHLENFSDLAHGNNEAEIKGFNYYNSSIQQQMQAFNSTYLSHVNSYTKLAYKDDPAIVALLITNENDLTHHFGNSFLPDKGVPIHNAIFSNDITIFSDKYNLSYDKTCRTWEWGESKLYLNDVEHRFNQVMLTHLKELGVRSLIATTNSWGGMGIPGLPALTDGSIIDTHSYGRTEESMYNPRFTASYLAWIAAAQVSGKPLTVSEWNIEPFPAEDRFTSPVYLASIANLQGWDAIMLYGYSQSALSQGANASNYSSFNDPAIMGLMPAAALLYRQNHVSPAKRSYELKLNRDNFFFKDYNPTTSKTIRTLLETSQLTIAMPDTPELPWLKNKRAPSANTSIITDANKDYIPKGQNFVESDTAELMRNWEQGIHTINTPQSQIASGLIGGKHIQLANVLFEINTKKAIVSIQSLKKEPINKSKNIFITVMARSEPINGNNLPFFSEPVTGAISLVAPKGLNLYPVTDSGKLSSPVPTEYRNGHYRINLTIASHAHWFVLR